MAKDNIESLSQPIDRKVPLNVTIRESIDARVNILVAQVQLKNPDKKKSHVIDQILSEKLDDLGIAL